MPTKQVRTADHHRKHIRHDNRPPREQRPDRTGQHGGAMGDSCIGSIGNAHVAYDVAAGKAFDDSVSRTRRDDGTGADSARAARAPQPQFKPLERRVTINDSRDIPTQSLAMRGARIITMKGKEVIANGDILMRKNRIVGVGPRGAVRIPPGTRTVEVSGKTIVPGFVGARARDR